MDATVSKLTRETAASRRHEIVVVGGGAGGIAVASSILRRAGDVDLAIIEPADVHYYQPGWTMVRRRYIHAGRDTPADAGRHAVGREVDQRRGLDLPAGRKDRHLGRRLRRRLHQARRGARPQARLGRRRGPRRHARLAWQLKARALPQIYWQAMLKGREPMAKPQTRPRRDGGAAATLDLAQYALGAAFNCLASFQVQGAIAKIMTLQRNQSSNPSYFVEAVEECTPWASGVFVSHSCE